MLYNVVYSGEKRNKNLVALYTHKLVAGEIVQRRINCHVLDDRENPCTRGLECAVDEIARK